VPLTGPFGVCFGVSPFNGMFIVFRLNLDILKLLSCSQTVGFESTRSISMSCIGPVCGVGATHVAVLGVFQGFAL